MKIGLWLIALVSGAALAAQVGMNNTLRGRMHHPLLAALTSFAIGTAALMIYVALARPALPSREGLVRGPWWMWCGGLVGAFYVAASSVFAARLGAAAWLGLIVTGQVVASVAMDHFGLLGFPRRPISPARTLGALCLLFGVVLFLWSPPTRPPAQVIRTGRAPGTP